MARQTVALCGLSIRDIARNPELDPQSPAAQDVWRVFTDLTEYRLYEDLREAGEWYNRIWNTWDCFVSIIEGWKPCAPTMRSWTFHPSAAALSEADREMLTRVVLDQFRRKLAISCRCLQETTQQQIRRRAEQNLNEFWGLDPYLNELRTASRFVRLGQSTRPAEGFSLNERSALGRFVRQRLDLDTADYLTFLDGFLTLLVSQGMLLRLEPVDDHQFFQLDAARVLWRLGDGSPPPPDPLYSRRAGATATLMGRRP